MTVKDLKNILSKFNDDDIIICYDDGSCSSFEFTPTMIYSKTKKKYKEVCDEYNDLVSSLKSKHDIKDELSLNILNSLKSDNSNIVFICTDY